MRSLRCEVYENPLYTTFIHSLLFFSFVRSFVGSFFSSFCWPIGDRMHTRCVCIFSAICFVHMLLLAWKHNVCVESLIRSSVRPSVHSTLCCMHPPHIDTFPLYCVYSVYNIRSKYTFLMVDSTCYDLFGSNRHRSESYETFYTDMNDLKRICLVQHTAHGTHYIHTPYTFVGFFLRLNFSWC